MRRDAHYGNGSVDVLGVAGSGNWDNALQREGEERPDVRKYPRQPSFRQ